MSGILGGVAFLVAAAFVVHGWVDSGHLPGFGSRPPWSSSSSQEPGTDPGAEAPPGPGRHKDPALGSDSHAAPQQLSVSPRSGSMWTTVTVTGSGFTRNGVVRLTFHATAMGAVNIDGDGDFTARMRLPSPDFYSRFPGQTFVISTTEYTRDGAYQGNGPVAAFHVD
ncbi:hypothetical protein ACIHFC_11395 [Streptomyces sp. NPDC052013]|uniref:hypothetical protein n=1 Tax=Streptomyces sp. NPDC052013 TaxID=3365679 RepID=UPI0037CE7E17